jgi:hypothetical protein
MRAAADAVAGMCTDLGTERRIPFGKDIIIPFLRFLKVPIPSDARPQRWLFPRAVLSAGWFHLWDGLLQFGLSSLTWFSSFNKSLKALSTFLRNDLNLVVDVLEENGLHGSASLLKMLKMPVFIAWRWGTISYLCKELRHAIWTMRENLSIVLPIFLGLKDGVRAKLIKVTLESAAWLCQFNLVMWFADHITETQNWGGTCWCCKDIPKEKGAGKFQCPNNMQGLLIPYAFAFGRERLDDLLSQAREWNYASFTLGEPFLQEVLAMVRSVFHRGGLKIQYLDEIPMLISRIGLEKGAGRRCVAQYDSAPAHLHDKTSVEFLDPASPRRAEILSYEDDDVEMAVLLDTGIRRIRRNSLLDKICEGPHSTFKRVQLHARGSNFPWQASSMRLDQNLLDAQTIPQEIGVSLQQTWDQYKTVIKPNVTSVGVRVSHKVVCDRVYNCSLSFAPPSDDEENDDDED